MQIPLNPLTQNFSPDFPRTPCGDSTPRSSRPRTSRMTSSRRGGFTLVELLVVMAIILILMGLVIGISGAASRGAAESKAKAEIANLRLDFDNFRADRGVYPQDFGQFIEWYGERYPGVQIDIDQNEDNLVDPWGEDYVIDNPNPNIVVIRSSGPSRNFNVDDNIRSDRL